jgi:linoleoyl-CoA desaturase
LSCPAPTITFPRNTEFRSELNKRVESYFKTNELSRRDDPSMYWKSAIMLGWIVVSYLLLVLWASGPVSGWLLSISMSLSMAGVAFCIQHDGGHRGYSNRKWVNRSAAFALDVLGGSSYIWHFKHNVRHHCYTNIVGADSDIDVGGLCRYAPQQRRFWAHRFQHFYMWFFYGLIAIKWHWWQDFYSLACGNIDGQPFPRPKGWALFKLISGKLVFAFLALAIPLYFHPVWVVGLVYAIVAIQLGITLTVVFVLAHCVAEANFSAADANHSEWTVHQIETTVDFSRNNRFLNWYLGGLNFQVEHHLFPNVCHVHYSGISRIVEAVCKEHGIRYKAHRTMFSALVSHYRWLREMGRAPQHFSAVNAEIAR